MEDQYWKDYSYFISKVENLTQKSPADLLNRYTELVLSLENSNGKDFGEFDFELSYDSWARVEIQKVLEEESLHKNELLKTFQKNVVGLDIRLEKYLENFGEKEWWKNPKFME